MSAPKGKKQMSIWGTIGALLLLAAVYGFEHWQKSRSDDKKPGTEQSSRRDDDKRGGSDRRNNDRRSNDNRGDNNYRYQPANAAGKGRSQPDNKGIEALWRKRADEVWVEGASIVVKVLPDDLDGSRHQRFLIRVNKNLRVKVAHNIDLAHRLPVKTGDLVEYRGKYAYNDLGGALHWTHHHPRKPGRGGWLRHKGKVYK